MHRREFLKLGAVTGGTILLGGTGRFRSLLAAPKEIPTIDRLVMTNLACNIYYIFAKGGELGHPHVTRNSLPLPYCSERGPLPHHARGSPFASVPGA